MVAAVLPLLAVGLMVVTVIAFLIYGEMLDGVEA